MNLERIFKNILTHRYTYGSVLLQVLAIVLGTIWCWNGYWIYLTITLAICYIIGLYKYQKALNHEVSLVREYKAQQERLFNTLNDLLEGHDLVHEFYENLIENSVLPFLEQLGFKHDPSFRISLYSHSEGIFTLLFRYSDDPDFKKKGRAVYPGSEGVIGEAYHRNSCVVTNLPDPQIEPEKWIESQLSPTKGRMKSKNTVKNLTMKSRSLIALPIRHGNNKHIIVVFESIEPNKLDLKKIQKILGGRYGQNLQNVLFMYRSRVEPSISIAEKMRL